jgi:hypothetical protein
MALGLHGEGGISPESKIILWILGITPLLEIKNKSFAWLVDLVLNKNPFYLINKVPWACFRAKYRNQIHIQSQLYQRQKMIFFITIN